MVRILIALLICFATPTWAQDGSQTRGPGPRKQIATIIFAGLAGGVLGLSTLSFYGRPQDKLANVPMGFGIGVIIGAIYTTYKAASEPRGFVEGNVMLEPLEPELWQVAKSPMDSTVTPLSASFEWSF